MLLTTPILLPIIQQMGLSPIWFGIFLVRAMEIGFVHPPIGMNLFVIHGIAKDVSIGRIFRGVVPFLVAGFRAFAAADIHPCAGAGFAQGAGTMNAFENQVADALRRSARAGARPSGARAEGHRLRRCGNTRGTHHRGRRTSCCGWQARSSQDRRSRPVLGIDLYAGCALHCRTVPSGRVEFHGLDHLAAQQRQRAASLLLLERVAYSATCEGPVATDIRFGENSAGFQQGAQPARHAAPGRGNRRACRARCPAPFVNAIADASCLFARCGLRLRGRRCVAAV